MRLIIILLSTAFLCCGTKTETVYRAGMSHQVHFTKSLSCRDYVGVSIVVGDSEYKVSERETELLFTLPEGRYTFIQYVHGYEVRRWVHQDVVKNTYLILECPSKIRKQQSTPGDRR